jgi:hypothetical protein
LLTLYLLGGCASVQFPKLGNSPDRPSVKSTWKETHTKEPVGTAACPIVYKETDTFEVGHSDSRIPGTNPIAKFFGWLATLGVAGAILFFIPPSLILGLLGWFVKKALEWRAALWQTVKGIKQAGEINDAAHKSLHDALASAQNEKTKDIVDDIRNKIA